MLLVRLQILLKVSDLIVEKLKIYISFCLKYRSLEQSYFHFQFIYVNIDRDFRLDMIMQDYQE